MSFLRLGVNCAVMDRAGRLLLSRRGDLDVWNLPGGRVDSGETLEAAARREVYEETGVRARIERGVGLYYLAGWKRLNVVYAGRPVGGKLRKRTNETRDNRFFKPKAIPATLWNVMALDAAAGTRHKPRVIETPRPEIRRTRRKLAGRWIKNFLMGRPEPRFPRFDLWAVGVVWDEQHRRVLTLPGGQGRVLPRMACTGEQAPWDELAQSIQEASGAQPAFRWVGLWQDAGRDSLEFVFAATITEAELPGRAEWSTARNTALTGLDAEYLERVKITYRNDPVWTILHEAGIKQTYRLEKGVGYGID